MDPVTHALSAAVLRNLGFSGRIALGVLLVSALAPDVDYASRLFGADVLLRYHRGLTHSITALLVFSTAVGFLLRRQKGGFAYYGFLAALGYGLHILLDLTNQYGTRALVPLSNQSFAMDLTFIVDPYIIAAFALSIVAVWLKRERARRIAAITMLLLALYMGGKHYFHERTEEFLRETMSEYSIKRVSPLPGGFMRWWFIAEGGGEIKVGIADIFAKQVYLHASYPAGQDDPAIERSRQSRVVRNFLYFSKHPYAQVNDEGGLKMVKWIELSYAYLPGDHFTALVAMDADGAVVSSSFKY